MNVSSKLREYLCSQMMKCIHVLHNAGFAHLDIKPDNFIINDDFSLSLIDFGYSQEFNSQLNKVLGTKSYLAPEFSYSLRDVSSEKADIYSMGITLNLVMRSKNSEWSNYQKIKEFAF